MRFLERFWFGCGHCHDGQGCPLATDADLQTFGTREYDHGLALVGAVLLVFILPLATAIGGAYATGYYLAGPAGRLLGVWQAGGAIAGFFAGVGLARSVFWARRRWSSTGNPQRFSRHAEDAPGRLPHRSADGGVK